MSVIKSVTVGLRPSEAGAVSLVKVVKGSDLLRKHEFQAVNGQSQVGL